MTLTIPCLAESVEGPCGVEERRRDPTFRIELSGDLSGSTRYEPPPAGWLLDSEHVEAVLVHWGVPGIGHRFRCILPGAAGEEWAVIDPLRLSYVRLDRQHSDQGPVRTWLRLAEVHASVTSGRIQDLRKPDGAPPSAWIPLMRWTDSLACEVGLATARTVMYEPDDMSEAERLVVSRFGQLYAINRHYHQRQDPHAAVPVKFTRDFASNWTGLSRRTLNDALMSLRERDVIRPVRKAQRAWMYVPGDGTQPPSIGTSRRRRPPGGHQ